MYALNDESEKAGNSGATVLVTRAAARCSPETMRTKRQGQEVKAKNHFYLLD